MFKKFNEKREKKKAVKQNWKLLQRLKCSYCMSVNKGTCGKHCELLLRQTKQRELEMDEEAK